MIDWLKFRVPFKPDREIGGERVMVIDPEGVIRSEWLKPLPVVGSHDGSLRVSCCPISGDLVIDGNPAKWFQGHNLFGSSDVRGLAVEAAHAIFARVDLGVTEQVFQALERGAFDVLRVDVTEMYSLRTRAAVRSALRSLEFHARMKHRGRGLMRGETLYFGQHSRRWAAKIYSKGDEIAVRGHGIPMSVPSAIELHEWADDKLRLEFVIRAMELTRRDLSAGHNWCDTTAENLHRELLTKLEIPHMIELPSATLSELPGRLQLAYEAWKRGDDLRARVSRPTFYRYRQELLKHGIDIAVLQAKEPSSNVVPLIQILRAVPAGVPDWARGTSLYFEPRRFAA